MNDDNDNNKKKTNEDITVSSAKLEVTGKPEPDEAEPTLPTLIIPKPSVHAEISASLAELPQQSKDQALLKILEGGRPEEVLSEALSILEESYKMYSHDPFLLRRKDIWVGNILPFLGPGHFLFLALVSKQLKEWYLTFFATIKAPPRVKTFYRSYQPYRAAVATNTFYSAAFSSVSCAKFWDIITKGDNNRLQDYMGRDWVCETIATFGNLEVLKWARQKKFPWDRNTCAAAAKGGHQEILKWANKNGCPWGTRTCANAAKGGYLSILKWARGGEDPCPWDEDTCREAARGGHLDVLQWARENDCPWDRWTCAVAAGGGHLEVLKWAREKNCAWDLYTCSLAARNGHQEVLEWARGGEDQCPWDEWTCSWAARGGHLDVLKWARENECPWNATTCACAAEGGHLKVLKWARENDCHWDEDTIRAATNAGHHTIAEWAKNHGCPIPNDSDEDNDIEDAIA